MFGGPNNENMCNRVDEWLATPGGKQVMEMRKKKVLVVEPTTETRREELKKEIYGTMILADTDKYVEELEDATKKWLVAEAEKKALEKKK